MHGPGDLIFHPSHGFGTVSGLTLRDPRHPTQEIVAGEGVPDQAENYYVIQLMDGGTLHAPVSRADRAGLRLLTIGVDEITMCLRSPARSLPEDARKRAAELSTRGHLGVPTAVVASVRDMLAQSHGRTLTASEQKWLNKSCALLSTEAALVDHIPKAQALAAILEAVNQVGGR